MNEQEARLVLKQAARNVDWHNFGVVVFNLGQLEVLWGKHTNDRWLPSYQKALVDNRWLKENFESLVEAIDVLYNVRPDKTRPNRRTNPLDTTPGT